MSVRPDEAGDTLIEVLITLIIISLCGLSLMTAFSATISGSAQQRSLAGNDVILRTVTEAAFSQIQQNQPPWYDPCATTSTYNNDFQLFLKNQGSNPLLPTGYTVTLTMQNEVLGSSGTWQPSDASTPLAGCSTMTMAPQLVTANVTAPNGTFDQTEFVVNGRNGISPLSAQPISIAPLSPPSLGQGYQYQVVSIPGTGFNDAANITICVPGTGVTTTCDPGGVQVESSQYNSPTSMSVTVSISPSAPTGAMTVIVTNPDNTYATATLTITPAPTVTTVVPGTLTQGASGVVLLVHGSGFQSGLTVTFSNPGITELAGSVSVTSSSDFSVTVNVDGAAALGGGTIAVTSGGVVGAPSPNILTVVGPPVITSPTSGSPCTVTIGTTAICTITGTGFATGDSVSLGNGGLFSSYTVTSVTATQITLSVTAGATAGTSDLTVAAPDGPSATVSGGIAVTS